MSENVVGIPGGPVDVVRRRLGEGAVLDWPLGAHTTYRAGGAAALAIEAGAEQDLVAVHDALAAAGWAVPVLVIGKGSNLLVSDSGFPGLVVRLGEALSEVRVTGRIVRGGGGASLPVLARRSAAASLEGLEWAVGVPGSVGGALKMNAGGHGSDIAAILERARVFDLRVGEALDRTPESLDLGYRRSKLCETDVVLWADFGLEAGDRSRAESNVAEIVRWRRAHQPGGSNAGSVFKNPQGDSAGRLVDAAGLKGFRIGSACVSPKHANFIQADDGGSADDVAALMAEVRKRVLDRFGVELEPELRMVGFSVGKN